MLHLRMLSASSLVLCVLLQSMRLNYRARMQLQLLSRLFEVSAQATALHLQLSWLQAACCSSSKQCTAAAVV